MKCKFIFPNRNKNATQTCTANEECLIHGPLNSELEKGAKIKTGAKSNSQYFYDVRSANIWFNSNRKPFHWCRYTSPIFYSHFLLCEHKLAFLQHMHDLQRNKDHARIPFKVPNSPFSFEGSARLWHLVRWGPKHKSIPIYIFGILNSDWLVNFSYRFLLCLLFVYLDIFNAIDFDFHDK